MAEIAEIKTIPIQAGGTSSHGIMVAVNSAADGLDAAFVRSLAKTIALHRMCSPPDTTVLLVSVIGSLDANQFEVDWSAAVADEAAEMQALRFFLGQMRSAALVHGRRDGTILCELNLSVG